MVATKPKPFKLGWFGDNGYGERLIQQILAGKRTATLCPEYDPEDAEFVVGDTLELRDKHGKVHGLLVVTRIEKRPFGTLDETVASAVAMTLPELRESGRVANGRELKADEEMRITYFKVVGSDRIRI